MLCIVTKRLQSKQVTTPSLNMAITGHFLCSTVLLDYGLLKLEQRDIGVLGTNYVSVVFYLFLVLGNFYFYSKLRT